MRYDFSIIARCYCTNDSRIFCFHQGSRCLGQKQSICIYAGLQQLEYAVFHFAELR
ncbi:hypothetical protein HanRHA438_Chr10g0458101 [Helianthus annuus]|nr:hypothetical protein HanRHA438_Chr10g0458101 [Helianthus annuus]